MPKSHLRSPGKRPVTEDVEFTPDKKLRGSTLPTMSPAGDTRVSAARPIGDVAMTMTTTTSTTQAQENGTGETPVELRMKRELGIFTETRTTILPLRFGVSFNNLLSGGASTPNANVLRLRLNAPYGILGNTVFVNQVEGAANVNGVSTNQALPFTTTNPTPLYTFETLLIPAGPPAPDGTQSGAGAVLDANCRPAWLGWYEKIYESYHVIETQYRITCVSPETEVGKRAAIYVDKDVYTQTDQGNVLPANQVQLTAYYLNSLWKGVDKMIVGERNNNDATNWIRQYSGTWRPGEWSKNTKNAEEVKAWYPVGAAPTPNWVEQLTLIGLSDEYNTGPANCNIFVELRYVIQFKDLRGTIRYPHHSHIATSNAVTLNVPADILQRPTYAAGFGSPY